MSIVVSGRVAIKDFLVIGFITIAQRDLKQMVGYSSVMHMGYAFLGVATMTAVGAGGVVLMMVAHGFSVALMFLLSTSVYHRTQTFDLFVAVTRQPDLDFVFPIEWESVGNQGTTASADRQPFHVFFLSLVGPNTEGIPSGRGARCPDCRAADFLGC